VTVPTTPTTAIAPRLAQQQIALVDLLDRVLAGGVVIAGDVILSIADVALVRVSLRALIVTMGADVDAPGRLADGDGEL
jgi:hypothetical protein